MINFLVIVLVLYVFFSIIGYGIFTLRLIIDKPTALEKETRIKMLKATFYFVLPLITYITIVDFFYKYVRKGYEKVGGKLD